MVKPITPQWFAGGLLSLRPLCLAVVLVIIVYFISGLRTDAFHTRLKPMAAHATMPIGDHHDRNMNELALTVSSTAIEAH